ncbi:hypothetical protein MMC17_008565 [Xylographa soralifera]|nr:hypothetical protein [Xylographa soralifera]
MARGPAIRAPSSDVDAINLGRALSRLEHKVLSVNADPRLLRSSYERSKTAANIEYARELLLRLEHTTSGIKIQSRKQAAQNERVHQRALIKRLNDRLYELGREDDGTISLDSTDDEDLLGEKALPPEYNPSASSAPLTPTLDTWKGPSVFHELTTSTLRSRLLPFSPPASKTAANPLFSNPTSLETPTLSAPTILESDSSTQAQLTSSLVQLAAALKQSSLMLSASLVEDNVTLSTTASALDKNTDGMSAASKRMGMLRSMSEGRWWWGRMLLYGMIGVLWLVALTIVFLMPKLRW